MLLVVGKPVPAHFLLCVIGPSSSRSQLFLFVVGECVCVCVYEREVEVM